MAEQTHIVRSDEPVRVVVEPASAAGEAWFRLFRSLVLGGTWAQLGPASAKVLIVLAECVNDQQRRDTGRWIAWPSVALIALRAGLQRRAVQKALADLEARGLVSRCRRRTAKRGDYSSEFELHPPAGDDASPAPRAHQGTHGGALDSAQAPAPPGAPAPRPVKRPPGARRSAQQSKTKPEKDSTETATEVARASAALADAGVAEPVRSRLLAERSPEELLLRVEDWQTRRRLGQKVGPAWLVASVRDRYELHEQTSAARERAARETAAEARRAAERDSAASEAEELDRVAAAAESLFAELSAEELEHWKARVLEEFPGVTRGLAWADPRENLRLRRLVLAKLAELVA